MLSRNSTTLIIIYGFLGFSFAILAIGITVSIQVFRSGTSHSFTETVFEDIDEIRKENEGIRRAWWRDWKRPDGPIRIALQAGHWQAEDVPEELKKLRKNGAYSNGYAEWEVNLAIALRTEEAILSWYPDFEVDVLPTTIPPAYYADIFIAIHADDNNDSRVSGFKIAAPWMDLTGKAKTFANILEKTYAESTSLPLDPNVTHNMRGYYAFNWRRYTHSLHPMTMGVILESGFLSNARDRRVIAERPEIVAEGIVAALQEYLENVREPI